MCSVGRGAQKPAKDNRGAGEKKNSVNRLVLYGMKSSTTTQMANQFGLQTGQTGLRSTHALGPWRQFLAFDARRHHYLEPFQAHYNRPNWGRLKIPFCPFLLCLSSIHLLTLCVACRFSLLGETFQLVHLVYIYCRFAFAWALYNPEFYYTRTKNDEKKLLDLACHIFACTAEITL
jgi:hypothetical protein